MHRSRSLEPIPTRRHPPAPAPPCAGRRSRRLAAALAAALAALLPFAAPAPAATGFGDAPEPLRVTDAFVPRVAATAPGSVDIEWDIADGYYLYRDKTQVDVGGDLADTVTIAGVTHSEARIVTDEFFGDSAVWRDSASMGVTLEGLPARTVELELQVRFQGCADIGLCYPPTTVSLNAEVPAPAPAAAPPPAAAPAAGIGSSNALDSLFGGSSGGGAEPELLRPEEAFVPLLTRTDTNTLEVRWDIEPGYYLYQHRFGFEVVDADGAPLAAVTDVSMPGGRAHEDEFFGEVVTFHDEALATVSLAQGLGAGDDAVLRAAYQGCAEIGVCFPPSTIDLPFVATAATVPAPDSAPDPASGTADPATVQASLAAAASAPTAVGPSAAALVSEQDRLSGLLASSSLWLSVATFFGLGLLLAFTPCVLPMVPILSSLVVGRDGDASSMNTGRAFRLSLVYVLVMASTYAIVGVIVALSGANVQVWLQQPWVLGLFAALFVVLALAMFGAFELEMPRFLQSKLTEASNAQAGGSYRGVVVMGLLSTLIVGPCVTAPLAGALIFIADTGDAVVGGAALFALGLGMGTPLLLIGTSAGSLLPRAGTWMVRVRQGFGVLLLGLAIWMLSRFVPETATVALAGLLALGTGIWLGAADSLGPDGGARQRIGKASGLAASIYGAALLVGALGGTSSLVSPLAVYGGGGAAAEEHELGFSRVANVEELDRVIASAAAEGRPVMLDFYADWCISCKEMEAYTFTDERVVAALEDVVLVQADVTKNDGADQALLDRFRLFAPPAIVFFGPDGREVDGARVVGFMPADRFGPHVERVLATTLAARD